MSFLSALSMAMPSTWSPCGPYWLCICSNHCISTLQGSQEVVQKCRRTALPWTSDKWTILPSTDSRAKSGAVCPLMLGVSPTDALRAWKLRSLRANSAVMPRATTMTMIDARFMVEVPLITRGDPATFLGAAHRGEGRGDGTGSRRLRAGLLLRLRQGRRGLNLDRGRFRVGNSLYLDVMSHVVGELVWILDGPYLVVAIGDQSQFGPLLEMIFVIALLVAGCGAHGVRDPTLNRDRLLSTCRHCGHSEE